MPDVYAVTPFTMEDVINDVLTELRYAPGRDVQIHLQDGIRADASRLYRTLMVKYVWRDFYRLTPITTDSATGYPLEDLTNVVYRFSDILNIYKDSESQPLQFAPALINPGQINKPMIVSVGQPHIFAIFPKNAYTLYMYSRIWRDTDFDLDDVIPFYRDVMVVGTAYMLSTKSGTNAELTKSLETQFNNLVDLYRDQEIKPQYQRPPYTGGIPTEWYSTDQ